MTQRGRVPGCAPNPTWRVGELAAPKQAGVRGAGRVGRASWGGAAAGFAGGWRSVSAGSAEGRARGAARLRRGGAASAAAGDRGGRGRVDAVDGDRRAQCERIDSAEAVRERLEGLIGEARGTCRSWRGVAGHGHGGGGSWARAAGARAGVLVPSVFPEGLARTRRRWLTSSGWAGSAGGRVVPRAADVAGRRGSAGRARAARSGGAVPGRVRGGRARGWWPGCAAVRAGVGFALPFGEAMAGDDGLSPAERTLLWLLLDGSTDATAARRLEVSRRTVRRTMSSLMGRLGARSSFEAGPRGAAGPTSGPRRTARPHR